MPLSWRLLDKSSASLSLLEGVAQNFRRGLGSLWRDRVCGLRPTIYLLVFELRRVLLVKVAIRLGKAPST